MTSRCRRPSCRKKFTYTPAIVDGREVLRIFCNACTDRLLSLQARTAINSASRDAGLYESVRSEWDYRIIDEYGDEVWALDLAARYHRETRPR